MIDVSLVLEAVVRTCALLLQRLFLNTTSILNLLVYAFILLYYIRVFLLV
jgi:hypothetical protein